MNPEDVHLPPSTAIISCFSGIPGSKPTFGTYIGNTSSSVMALNMVNVMFVTRAASTIPFRLSGRLFKEMTATS